MLNMNAFEDAGISITNLRAVGGGTLSDRWLQLKADLTGKPITISSVPEASALGAAVFASCAAGYYSDIQEVTNSLWRLGKTYSPNLQVHPAYRETVHTYRELFLALQKLRSKFVGRQWSQPACG
jgi:xylulokinase